MRESDLRELAGLSPKPEVEFLGERWAVREDGLAPLIRYTRACQSDDPEAGISLAVIYRLFSDCVIDFEDFAAHAFEGKADEEDVGKVVSQLAEVYCARNQWPAMRLIAFVGANLEELDGKLLQSGGRGLKYLSAREACNLALAELLEGRDEEDRQIFLMDLEYEGDAASEALAELRKFQQQKAEAKPDGE